MATGKRIWIRADANEGIASGHLARTLSIARELRKMGAEVRFVLADETSRDWLLRLAGSGENWSVSLLEIPYGTPERELPILAALARREAPDWILVDSYAVSDNWFGALRRALWQEGRAFRRDPALAFLDDEQKFDPDVDLVINYDPDTEALRGFYHAARACLLGPSYAPLREEFSEFSGKIPPVRPFVRRILISTGGTDPYAMAERLQDILGLCEQKDGRRMVAKAQEPLSFAVMAPGYPRVLRVAELLKTCDLAVSAAGTTLYELCAAGVPTLSFAMADNQALFARKMEAVGAVTYLGDVRNPKVQATMEKRVRDWLEARRQGEGAAANAGWALRQQEASCMHALTDGLGSRRIARELLNKTRSR